MSVATIYPHIHKSADEPARLERLPRIRIAQIVMDYYAHGWSAEEMCRQHPYLKPGEVHAALTYFYDHEQEIEDEIAKERALVEQDRNTAKRSLFFMRMRAKGLLQWLRFSTWTCMYHRQLPNNCGIVA